MSDYKKSGFKDVIAKPYNISTTGQVINPVMKRKNKQQTLYDNIVIN